MSRRARQLVGVAVIAMTVSVCVAPALSAASPSVRTLSPPVIHERFTLLPCTGKPNDRDTLQQEGCAEHGILTTDTQINALARTIFSALPDNPARRQFIAAQDAWIAYRRADCLSISDTFEGGTQAPVLDAQCSVGRNRQRIKDLRAFLGGLKPA
jgi:uncharacterized protein YecT (DUF1311 family)